MRRLQKLIVPAVILALASALAAAQERARGMFVDKKADGLEIKVLKNVGGQFQLVSPSQEFRAGDEIRVQFRSNFDGFVYFVNVTPKGETRVIYNSPVRADVMNELPGTPNVIKFDDKDVGTEILKVVISRQRLPLFEDAIKNADGMLGKSAASVASELADAPPAKQGKPAQQPAPSPANKPANAGAAGAKPAGGKSENVGIIQPDNDPKMRCRGLELGREFRCRGIELAKEDAKKNEGAVMVAIPDTPQEKADAKLKPGDVAIIEIRLKHI
jgi:hypothetical protein